MTNPFNGIVPGHLGFYEREGSLARGIYIVPAKVAGVILAVGDTYNDLSWDEPEDNGLSIIDYKIERSTDNFIWATVSETVSDDTSFRDTGLTGGTKYYYRIAAINIAGIGAASDVVSGTTRLAFWLNLEQIIAAGSGGNSALAADPPPTIEYTIAQSEEEWVDWGDHQFGVWGDIYLKEGVSSIQAAQNIRDWLVSFASQDAFRVHKDQTYEDGGIKDYVTERNWVMCSILAAYLKAKTSSVFSANDIAAINAWLLRISDDIFEYYNWEIDYLGSKNNNHLQWASLAQMQIGIAANDLPSFNRAVASVKHVFDDVIPDQWLAGNHENIRMVGTGSPPDGDFPRGALTIELERGNAVLFYHLYWTTTVTISATIARANGINLFEYDGQYGNFDDIYTLLALNHAENPKAQTYYEMATTLDVAGAPTSIEELTADEYYADSDKFCTASIWAALYPTHIASDFIYEGLTGGQSAQLGGDIDFMTQYLLRGSVATVPDQVRNFKAGVTDSGANLSWVRPYSGGLPITDYKIERSTNGSDWTVVSDGVSTALLFSDSGLTNDVLYYYRISAINAVGTGEPSKIALVVPLDSVPVPLEVTAATTVSMVLVSSDGSDIEVDWGDGSSAENAVSGVEISHVYGSPYTGDVTITPIGLATLTSFSSDDGEWSFDLADLPSSLLYFLARGDHTITGDLINLPPDLYHFDVDGFNTIYGNIGNLPYGLLWFEISGLNTVTGSIVGLPRGLTHLHVYGNNTITGNIVHLPPGITWLVISGNNTLSGNVANLPNGLITYRVHYSGNTITGDAADIPRTVTEFRASGGNTIGGILADLPPDIEHAEFRGASVIGGDLEGLPAPCTYLRAEAFNTITATGAGMAHTSMRFVQIEGNGGATATVVDNILISLAGIATWTSEKTIQLAAANAAPTAASSAARSTLAGYGVTVNVN